MDEASRKRCFGVKRDDSQNGREGIDMRQNEEILYYINQKSRVKQWLKALMLSDRMREYKQYKDLLPRI